MITRKSLLLIVPLLMTSAGLTPVLAQDSSAPAAETDSQKSKTRYIVTRADLGEVLRYNGLDYKTDKVDDKDVFVVDFDGIISIFKFYGEETELDSILLYAGFKGNASSTAQRMNQWNSEHRFTRAYIDAEGDPVLEMDVNMAFGGTSERHFEDALGLWEESVLEFRKFVYEDSKETNDGDKAKAFLQSIRD